MPATQTITSFGVGGEGGQAISQIGAGAAAGCVAGPVGCAAGAAAAAVKVGISDLLQHTARLQDATNENSALDALIPAFDADLESIAQAFNSGAADKATCVAALQQLDSTTYAFLRKQVGKPGTAWGGPSTTALGLKLNPSYSITCNSNCTAGCCVYLNDLRPAIFGRSGLSTSYQPWQVSPGLVGGMIGAIQTGGGVVKVITVAPPSNKSYGDYQRTGYTITIKAPPITTSIATSVLGIFGAKPSPVGTAVAPAKNIFSSLTGNTSIAILTVVGGLILIVTALFGQNALRVK